MVCIQFLEEDNYMHHIKMQNNSKKHLHIKSLFGVFDVPKGGRWVSENTVELLGGELHFIYLFLWHNGWENKSIPTLLHCDCE